MSHWPAISEGDGSLAFECRTRPFVYFPDRGAERHTEGKMVDQIFFQLKCVLCPDIGRVPLKTHFRSTQCRYKRYNLGSPQ